LTERLEALERRVAERVVVDFVRQEKGNAEAPVKAEPKLAAEIVARAEKVLRVKYATGDAKAQLQPQTPEASGDPKEHLEALKPKPTIAVSKMKRFTQKASELM
jgi:type IV secretion system protein VirD4